MVNNGFTRKQDLLNQFKPIYIIFYVCVINLLVACGGGSSSSDSSSSGTSSGGTTTPSNNAPTAKAGDNQNVTTGTSVTLDGSESSDQNGDTLSYSWSFSSLPAGSAAVLSNDKTQSPNFTPDIDGDYVISLTVNDGTTDSSASSVTISATTPINNNAPTAKAGDNQNVSTGTSVTLDGSTSSDQDGDTLSYSWSFSAMPSSSSASLNDPNIATPMFTADVEGDYVLNLVVNDGTTNSEPDSVTITASLEIMGDFYTPAPIKEALQLTRNISWTELPTSPNNLQRFSMGPTGETSILALTDDESIINSELTIVDNLVNETSSTDDLLLRSMFQLIEIETNIYRIITAKHSNYALDVDDQGVTDKLVIRDFRSINNIDTNTTGFLTFTITNSSTLILSATGRKKYDLDTNSYVDDNSWTSKEILLEGGSLSLTSATGTTMTLYSPAINLDIPFDFNPDKVARVANDEVPPETKDDAISGTASKIVDAYSDQVTAIGLNESTATAAANMLETIQTTLKAEGAELRYPVEFYTAFRNGLLARTVQSSDATDSTLGQETVPYVFYTNEADEEGVHHPFMVIASYGIPDSMALLWDVPKPPGDGTAGTQYEEQNVTRSYHRESFLMKIPLRDYGEVESLTENDMSGDLASDRGETDFTHHNYASLSATGVAVDGVIIYPSYNNSLHVAQADAEISAHGMHSGRGLGVHYHADAHSATKEGLNLYNTSDYEGHTHPPIISMGFDGVAGYGIYQDGDTTSDGVDINLDSFGGHEHGAYGYHYHSFTEKESTPAGTGPDDADGETEYTKHMLPPLGAWSGRINEIPEFWDNTSPNYVGGNSIYLGTQ